MTLKFKQRTSPAPPLHRRIMLLPQKRPLPFYQEELFMFFYFISVPHDLPALTGCSQSDDRPPSCIRQDFPLRFEKRPSAVLSPLRLTASTRTHIFVKRHLPSDRPGQSLLRNLLRLHLSKTAAPLRLHHHLLRNHDVLTGKKALPYPARPADFSAGHQHTTAL